MEVYEQRPASFVSLLLERVSRQIRSECGLNSISLFSLQKNKNCEQKNRNLGSPSTMCEYRCNSVEAEDNFSSRRSCITCKYLGKHLSHLCGNPINAAKILNILKLNIKKRFTTICMLCLQNILDRYEGNFRISHLLNFSLRRR